MTPVERRLAGHLLRMASDQFSNHGCNDFDLEEFGLDRTQRLELMSAVSAWDGNEDLVSDSKWAMDWLLMAYLANLLLRPAPTTQGGEKP